MAQEFMLSVVLKVWLDLFKLFSKDHIMDSAKWVMPVGHLKNLRIH